VRHWSCVILSKTIQIPLLFRGAYRQDMRIRTLIYYITTGFVIGVIALVAVQYITSANVRELITTNENLLKEYRLSNALVGLQKDLLLLDNNMKGALLPGDSARIRDFRISVKKVGQDLRILENASGSDTSLHEMIELQRLVSRKLEASQSLVDHFYRIGTTDKEIQSEKNEATKFTEVIIDLTHQIDSSGKQTMAEKIKLVDRSGQRVLNWNFYIIVLVLILLTAVFLVIIGRMKKQAGLIAQLNRSEKKLKEAALIKENFLANMSHEIRTPLNAILGYTNLLQRKNLDDDSRLHVTTVQQSGETLLAIVNDILDLSKIESGMMRIEEAPFYLSELVNSVAAMFHHKIEEKGLKLSVLCSAESPDRLVGDATRLTQILVNLIGNAVKFTSEGEIKLDIKKSKSGTDRISVVFTITDTGIGIGEDKLETIFERFRQAEDSTSRKFGGTGLGLAIVRDLVYLQNGEIDVKSKPGVGTSVEFSIRYKFAEVENMERQRDVIQPYPEHFNNLNVLIVEDNVINQGLMKHIMQEWQVKHKVADNGTTAIQMLEQYDFDLVFMDIQMPGMDGYTATAEIRNVLKSSVPIVAMTAHAMQGEREKCLRSGMNEHISKPVRENDLWRIFSLFFGKDASASNSDHFEVIDLTYMKEISNGDTAYEKMVTEQFLTLVPLEIDALKSALLVKDFVRIQQIAHSMKTSISIMGLDCLIAEDLDMLDRADQNTADFPAIIGHVSDVCTKSLSEAKLLYSRF